MNKTVRKLQYSLPVLLLTIGHLATAAPLLPYWAVQTFEPGAPIDNPFFPMTDFANTYVYQGEGEDDEGEVFIGQSQLTNLGPGPVILGVQTQIQRDEEFEDGLLIERTFDYYAQDTAGNVWYFGENVTIFEYDDDDNLIGMSNDGEWIAGEGDNLPGIIMLAGPQPIGFNYYQEYAPGIALDNGTTFSVDNEVTIDLGTYAGVLQILEGNEIDPDAREFKYYAPGTGLILVAEDLNEMFQDPETVFELVAIRPIPVPASAWLFGSALGLLGWIRRRTAA